MPAMQTFNVRMKKNDDDMMYEMDSDNNSSTKSCDHGVSKIVWWDRWSYVEVNYAIDMNNNRQNNICNNHDVVIATDTFHYASTLSSIFETTCDLLKCNGYVMLSRAPRCSSVNNDVMCDAKHSEELTHKDAIKVGLNRNIKR